jgi:hypothetical protein
MDERRRNNTSKSKAYIEQAIRNLPQDFAVRDVRVSLQRALNEINVIDKKRGRRTQVQATPWEKWNMDRELGKLVPPHMTEQQRTDALVAIDNLIAAEEQKIKEAKEKKHGNDDLFLG